MPPFLAILLALQAVPEGPPGRFAFRSYGSEQGLENLVVIAVAQDAEGYLWAGTEDGLYRYDGDHFHRYGIEEGLPSTDIKAIAIGDRGEVWAGTSRGVAVLQDGRFRAPPLKLADLRVTGLAVLPKGGLFI